MEYVGSASWVTDMKVVCRHASGDVATTRSFPKMSAFVTKAISESMEFVELAPLAKLTTSSQGSVNLE